MKISHFAQLTFGAIRYRALPLAGLGLFACSGAAPAPRSPDAAAEAPVQLNAHTAMTTAVALVPALAVAKGELPEGLAISGGVPFIGLAPTAQISKVDLSSGSVVPFASLPAPVPNKGFMTGLAFSKNDLYACLVSFAPEVQAGIYRVGAAGGTAELFAHSPDMVFPNGLITDRAGNWLVTESAAGAVLKISADGKSVEKWATSDLLAGDSKSSCASQRGAGLPFNIGANGIAQLGDAVYVTNTDKGTVIRIPVQPDGKAGTPSVFAGPDCAGLGGADGIVANGEQLFVATNFQNRITVLNSEGTVSTLAEGAPLDFPASLAFSDGALFATSFAFMNAQSGKGSPGLVRIAGGKAR